MTTPAQYYPTDRQITKARAARNAFEALTPAERMAAMIARSDELLAVRAAKVSK